MTCPYACMPVSLDCRVSTRGSGGHGIKHLHCCFFCVLHLDVAVCIPLGWAFFCGGTCCCGGQDTCEGQLRMGAEPRVGCHLLWSQDTEAREGPGLLHTFCLCQVRLNAFCALCFTSLLCYATSKTPFAFVILYKGLTYLDRQLYSRRTAARGQAERL